MKIRLIEPEPPGMHVWAKVLLPRLGLPIIAATLKANGHDVLVYNPTMAPIDWDDVNTSDLVGLSSTTSTATTAYGFAEDLHGKGIPVVIGGSHVTFMADEALEHVDYVARGEGGEQLMLELIEALAGDRELDTIAGLSFKRDGLAVHNPPREALADLDELPFPDLRLLVGSDRLTTMPIMTSWGCPFDCTFCSVTAMFGKKYRFRSAESVIAELKDKRPERIFFYDDNMAANRKRLKKLLQMMIDEDLVIPWSAQVRTDVVRDAELLDLMRRSGCKLVYLGLESVNQRDAGPVREVADGGRHREGHQGAARLRHQEPRHVRAGRRRRRRPDRPRHGRLRHQEQDRHGDAQHPHAAPRARSSSRSSTRRAASSTSAGSSTTPTTSSSSRRA